MAPSKSLRLSLLCLFALAPLGCARTTGPEDPPEAVAAPATLVAPHALSARPGIARRQDRSDDLATTRWCLKLRPGTDAAELAAEYGLDLEQYVADSDLALVRGPADIARLRQDPRVLHAETNQPLSIDDPQDMLMGFHQGDWDPSTLKNQDALAALQLTNLHSLATGAGIKIAVLDTGADITHPLLAGHVVSSGFFRMLVGVEYANGRDDDRDGLVDEAFGHGTHVAGVLATLAPEAELLPLRILNDDGTGTEFELAVGLHLANLWGAQVVNLSLRMGGYSAIVADALARLHANGAVILAAAGNQPGANLPYPASDPHVVAVAATDMDDLLAWFSTSTGALLAAPGVHVESAYPANRWAWASGTSVACAVAAGSLAAVASIGGPDSMEQTLLRIRETAVTVSGAPGLLGGRVAPLSAALLLQSAAAYRAGEPAAHPTAMNGAQL